MAMTNAKICTV